MRTSEIDVDSEISGGYHFSQHIAGGQQPFAEGMNEVALLGKQSFEEQGESQVEQGFCDDTKQGSCPKHLSAPQPETLLEISKAFIFNLLLSVVPPVF